MVSGLLIVGLLLANPASASERLSPFLLSIPATQAEPAKAEAEVQFVSNGYFIGDNHCVVTRSSGSAAADLQACKTVIFRAASKPVNAKAPVWIADPAPAGYIAPLALSKKPPVTTDDYPSSSLNKNEQGTVVVRVVVGADGKTAECGIASTSGYARLDNAGKLALCRRLKVSPATLDGVPVSSINFTQVAFYSGH